MRIHERIYKYIIIYEMCMDKARIVTTLGSYFITSISENMKKEIECLSLQDLVIDLINALLRSHVVYVWFWFCALIQSYIVCTYTNHP